MENKTKSPIRNTIQNFKDELCHRELCTREDGLGSQPREEMRGLQRATKVAPGPSQLLLHPAYPQFSSSLSSGLMAGLVRL